VVVIVILSNFQEKGALVPTPPSPLKSSLLIWSSHQRIKAEHPKVVRDKGRGGLERRQDIKKGRERQRDKERQT
jgi:hypothetical protein